MDKTAKSGGDGAAARRGGGLRALAASLPKAVGKAFGRRGLAEGGLIADWPDIVGAELAEVCLPRGLAFPSRERRSEGTLSLRVEPGHALTLQHLEPLLIERINGYLGYGAVARLRLQQGPLGRPVTPPPKPPAPLSAAQEAALKARGAAVADPELRDALERLGRAVQQCGREGDGS